MKSFLVCVFLFSVMAFGMAHRPSLKKILRTTQLANRTAPSCPCVCTKKIRHNPADYPGCQVFDCYNEEKDRQGVTLCFVSKVENETEEEFENDEVAQKFVDSDRNVIAGVDDSDGSATVRAQSGVQAAVSARGYCAPRIIIVIVCVSNHAYHGSYCYAVTVVINTCYH